MLLVQRAISSFRSLTLKSGDFFERPKREAGAVRLKWPVRGAEEADLARIGPRPMLGGRREPDE